MQCAPSLVPVAAIILGRDVLLSLSAFYIRYTSLPAPVGLPLLVQSSSRDPSLSPENVPEVLGLFHPFSGSAADPDQQGQGYLPHFCVVAREIDHSVGQHRAAVASHGNRNRQSDPSVRH